MMLLVNERPLMLQSSSHNLDQAYPNFGVIWKEVPSPINFLLEYTKLLFIYYLDVSRLFYFLIFL